MKKVIITADDFGFTNEMNRGIIETVESGITTEIGLMINCYGTDEAVEYAKKHNWKNVGLHLSLFNTNNGERPYRNNDYDRILEEKTGGELCQIISDEIKKFEDTLGQKPSHINGHKRLHFHPKTVDYIFDYASHNNIFVRKWEDCDTQMLIPMDTKFVENKFKEHKIKTSNYLFGFEYDFENPVKATNKYEQMLDMVSDGESAEILFHPGRCGDFEKTLTSFIKEREADRELLCSGEFKEMLMKNNFILVKATEI
jgi:predicted glycoside hydrolase/deacetylase ChbG (UPF0249 family)